MAVAHPVMAGDFKVVSAPVVAAVVGEAANAKGARITEDETNHLTVIENKQTMTTFVATKVGHAAHPSLMIKAMSEIGGVMYVDTSGYTAGDACQFDAWVKQFDVTTTGLCDAAD